MEPHDHFGVISFTKNAAGVFLLLILVKGFAKMYPNNPVSQAVTDYL